LRMKRGDTGQQRQEQRRHHKRSHFHAPDCNAERLLGLKAYDRGLKAEGRFIP
jgi:hypothetical protein